MGEVRRAVDTTLDRVAAVCRLLEEGGVGFPAMERVRGRTLTEEIARGLAPDRVLELALAAAAGTRTDCRADPTTPPRDRAPREPWVLEPGRREAAGGKPRD